MCVRKNRSSSWITKHKRWLLYTLHDFPCAYCGTKLTEGAFLTLDHIVPIEYGGTHNKADNLVTSCRSCNSSKEARSLRSFLMYLRNKDVDTDTIKSRIRSQRRHGARVEAGKYKTVTKEHTNLLRTLVS